MAKYDYNAFYLTKDGKPWFPVMGEIHYSRYPKQYWKESIYKMKAGGVDIISCYVIWLHHEEIRGCYDFEGNKDLRAFIETVKECGMKMILRIGPWAHGEVRNGGFPDWLLALEKEGKMRLRTNDPAYLEMVRSYYHKIGELAQGLLDKDGGPIIGIQLENEYGHVGGMQGEDGEQHMRNLKALAIEAGFDVNIMTATGWGGAVTGGVIPVMGGYCDAPWDQRLTEIEPSGNYIFTPERNDHNIGSDYGFGHGITFDISKFPFLTAELGGGLQVTHHRRPVAAGKDVAAMSLAKMGSGCNLLGYYMYHGGTNPDGVKTTVQESRATGYPNDLPIKSYDFNAPIREFGQLTDGYREIRMLATYLHDFEESFCCMKPHFPKDNPLYPTNQTDLRYTVRHDGEQGVIFVNNYQRRRVMAEHPETVLKVELEKETITFPPIDIKDGDFFFLPFNMPLGKHAILKTAAVTPLCRIGEDTYVFYGDRDPQFEVEGDLGEITLISLSREEAAKASKVVLDREYLVISDADVIPMEDGIHLRGKSDRVSFQTWPALTNAPEGFTVEENEDFAVYTKDMTSILKGIQTEVTIQPMGTLHVEPVIGEDGSVMDKNPISAYEGADEKTLEMRNRDGKCYLLQIAGAEAVKTTNGICDAFLEMEYQGNRIEFYEDGNLISDGFFTGQKAELGLKRFACPDSLVLAVYPFCEGDPIYLEKLPRMEDGVACCIDSIKLVPEWDVVI